MRIAHVTATFPPHYTGTGVVCYHNALGLARLGHQVTVFTAACPLGDYRDPPELTIRRLPVLFRLGNAPFLPGLLQLHEFDLVHLHYPFYFGAEMVWLGSLGRRFPYVATYHQDVLFRGLLRFPERLHHWLIGRRVLWGAAGIIATSLDYARASRLAEFVRQGLVVEVPNGVDGTRFHPGLDGASLRRRYGLGAEERVVLFVGALDQAHYFKGVSLLLRAVANLPDVRLLLVGEGNLRVAYQAQAAELGLGERAVFCGRVPDEELAAHYALGDLLALPSVTMGEAFGVVLLEAMACGKPVIASDLPGVRSVVSDGVDGLLVQPGDVEGLAGSIRSLVDDPERRREMGERGRAKVEAQYDWSVVIPRLVEIYEEALAGGR